MLMKTAFTLPQSSAGICTGIEVHPCFILPLKLTAVNCFDIHYIKQLARHHTKTTEVSTLSEQVVFYCWSCICLIDFIKLFTASTKIYDQAKQRLPSGKSRLHITLCDHNRPTVNWISPHYITYLHIFISTAKAPTCKHNCSQEPGSFTLFKVKPSNNPYRYTYGDSASLPFENCYFKKHCFHPIYCVLYYLLYIYITVL